MTPSSQTQLVRGQRIGGADIIGSLIVLCASIVRIFSNGWSAYVWPTADGFAYFEGAYHEHLAQSDYFTVASMDPNPRHIFYGLIDGLGSISGFDYYQIIFTMWMTVAVLIPLLCYNVLCVAGGDRIKAPGKLAIASAVAIWATFYDHRFATGSWMPLPADATSQGLSLVIGLSALWVIWARTGVLRYAVVGAGLFFAALIHPVNAMALTLFWMVAGILRTTGLKQTVLDIAVAGVSGLTAVMVLLLLYDSSLDLTVEQFIDCYVYRSQPYHFDIFYMSEQYKTWINLAAVTALGAWSFMSPHDSKERVFAVILLALSPALLAVQFVAVEVIAHPSLIMLGPTRMFMVVPWLAVVAFACRVSLPIAGLWSQRISINFGWIVAAACLVAGFFGLRPADDPIENISPERREVVQWIEEHTEPSELIFCNDPFMESFIRHFAQRPVLIGKNFPFTPSLLSEYDQRLRLREAFDDNPVNGAQQLAREKNVALIVVRGDFNPELERVFMSSDGVWKVYQPALSSALGSGSEPDAGSVGEPSPAL